MPATRSSEAVTLRAAARHAIWPIAGGVVLLLAGACSSHGEETTGLTAEEQHQLNDAAAVLDANTADPPATDAHESSAHD